MIQAGHDRIQNAMFQIPQGQSSNFKSSFRVSFLECFKSHRDKVQMKNSYQSLFDLEVSNPQGQSSNKKSNGNFPCIASFQIPQGQSSNLFLFQNLYRSNRFKSHRDKVQILPLMLSSTSVGSFKSHRDKVQMCVKLQEMITLLNVSNPIGTKFKYY